MKRIQEMITRSPIWVNPEHTTHTAAILMSGYHISALPVMDGEQLIGMLTAQSILCVDAATKVQSVMDSNPPRVSPNYTIRETAEIMNNLNVEQVAILDENKLIGVITRGDIFSEIGRFVDPLTQLPWTDSMRDWAIEKLRLGNEISVLFIDMDDFGKYNKKFGHIVGDQVLQAVAESIAKHLQPEIDFACRYGGDEFCVVTTRPSLEATTLGNTIQRAVEAIHISSIDSGNISCTLGQYVGKRTREREHIHYASTLNNLINLASKDCTSKKVSVAESESTPKTAPLQYQQYAIVNSRAVEKYPRFKIAKIDMVWKGFQARVRVELELGENELEGNSAQRTASNRFTATSSADTDEEGALRLVAETTASALRGYLPDEFDVVLSDVLLSNTTGQQQLITVVGQFTSKDRHIPIAGSVVVTEGRYRAVVAATLAAANRSLGMLISQNR